jgi:hypothetical protein
MARRRDLAEWRMSRGRGLALAVLALSLLLVPAAAAAPPVLSATINDLGQVVVNWKLAPGQNSSDIYWNTGTPTPPAPGTSGSGLGCNADTCTGYQDLGDSQKSATIAGLAPGTYYLQLVVNEPTSTSSYNPVWSNVLTVVVPPKSSGGTNKPAPAKTRLGKIPHDNGTKACDRAIAKIKYANNEIKKALNNLKFVDKTGNASVQAVRKAQLQKRLQSLQAQLPGLEKAAAAACK